MGEMTEVALKLRHEFDARADDLDRSGGYPQENYERMTETGYLRGPVPEPLGGLGADLVEFAGAQRALAWGCASTALMVNMHLFQVGAAAQAWHASGANEALLRRVADEGIVLGSTGAEAIVAGAWETASTAEADGDDYIVTGRKFFCSQADLMDIVRVNARDTATGDILVLAVPATAPGVDIVHSWDAMGMRGTASHELVLDHVRVPATAVGVRLPAGGPAWHPAFAGVIRWFLSGVSAVYVGLADRAREAGHDAVGRGNNSTFRDAALTEVLVGRLEVAHFRASAVLDAGLHRVASAADPVDAMIAAVATKEESTAAAVEVVDRAVDLAGGRAYLRPSVLERLARDVRAARHHPPADPVSFQMIGRHAAGSPPASTGRS
jgi:alkylation response protein AidB-like acyl-CoA dehydrogenase